MSYLPILIKILLIYCLVHANLQSNKKRVSYSYFCYKDSDCNKAGFLDCFCLTPKCYCYLDNETLEMGKYFNTSGLDYGEKCSTNKDCRYTQCHLISKTCLCFYYFHREKDLCVEGQIGYPCGEDCSLGSFCDANIGYKCNCYNNAYKKPNYTKWCTPKVMVGHPCDIDEACGTRALCKNGICKCNPKEQYHEDGWCNPKIGNDNALKDFTVEQ